MLSSTLSFIRCPRCAASQGRGRTSASLKLRAGRSVRIGRGSGESEEIVSGSLVCEGCRFEYPILAGVAILVEDVGDYLVSHVKGIAREVPEAEFPKTFRVEMARARREFSGAEHIEDDLESERVASLYVMTQYLGSRELGRFSMSPPMQDLVKRYWDQGPFARLREELGRCFGKKKATLLELGCGTGGLLPALGSGLSAYLGVDSSFASIVQARRLALGIDHRSYAAAKSKASKGAPLRVPEDLLFGAISRDISAELRVSAEARRAEQPVSADFVVGDVLRHPLRAGSWDACVALNLIDMLDRVETLPEVQKDLLIPEGWVFQSSPYIWHPRVAKNLAKKFPRARSSSEAVRRLYEAVGFRIEGGDEQIPWLFFKNSRQIELYSVDLFSARAKPLG